MYFSECIFACDLFEIFYFANDVTMKEEIETCGCMPQTAYVLLLYKLMPQYYIAVLFVRHSLTLHNLDVTVHGPTFLHSNLVS